MIHQDQERITKYIDQWEKEFDFKDIDRLSSFSKKMENYQKKRNQFYLYDRCDGSDPTFKIYQNVFIFNEVWEEDFHPIKKVQKLG